ncbi:MAG: membrane protein insertase YidC [Chlorobi bacterium]|nr:membrane protein insertase YidC [Chlorobiota bacterium]
MDKKSVIGFIAIALILMVWMYMNTPNPEEIQRHEQIDTTTAQKAVEKPVPEKKEIERKKPPPIQEKHKASASDIDSVYGSYFAHLAKGEEKTFTVETDKFIVVFSSKGGGIHRFILKKFFTWNKNPVQLIDWQRGTDFHLLFSTVEGKVIDTRELFFRFENIPDKDTVRLTGNDSLSFELVLPVIDDSAKIIQRFTVRNGRYDVGCVVDMRNMGDIIANYEYQVMIHSPNLTEQRSDMEATYAEAYAMIGDTKESIDATSMEEVEKKSFGGRVHWAGVRNKYFMNAIIVDKGYNADGVYLEGISIPLPNEGKRKVYTASLKIKYTGETREEVPFLLFFGPLQYNLLREYKVGLEEAMSFGWAWVVRPFTEYLMMPLFVFLHTFIPNYGVVLVVISILIKIVLYPLTKTSMQSMRKMQALQPMMSEMKEKYKDEPQKLNSEMMKLYKEYGVNPMGGCLPMVFQMPILYALFVLFNTTIELRQQPFILWIKDLSQPDIIFHLPDKLPLIGIQDFSGLAILMGITMFIQQKMSVKDPRQKSMVYIMPVMFTLLFNGFPSGLNLYYFMFNLLSIGQQWMINKRHEDEPLKKVKKKKKKNKKRGWLENAMAEMQKKANTQKKGKR